MIVADKLKKTNRAEYLLYMWQVEDIIRAYHCDSDRIAQEYISQFNLPSETRKATEEWYANLCEMMRSEGKKSMDTCKYAQTYYKSYANCMHT